MKRESHCTVRTDSLFCSHCGQMIKLPFPVSISMFSGMSKAFEKEHRNCKQTWKQPEPDQAETRQQKERFWIQNGEHGTSSKTMFSVMNTLDIKLLSPREFCHPYDPDDFKRCYLLLEAVPEMKTNLPMMKNCPEPWPKLIDNWDKLTEMYEENKRTGWTRYKEIGMYEFMKSLGC